MAGLNKVSCKGPDCRRNHGRIGLHRIKHSGLIFCSSTCRDDFIATGVSEPNPVSRLIVSFLKTLEERFTRHEPTNTKSYKS